MQTTMMNSGKNSRYDPGNRGGGNLHELNGDPPFSMRDIFSILFEWRYFIMMITLIAAVATFVAVSGRQRIYEAKTSVLIDPRGIEVLDRDITPRAQSTDGNIAIVEGQMRIMHSDTVMREVVSRENLASDPEFNGRNFSLLEIFRNILGVGGNHGIKEEVALHRLKKASGVSRPKLGYVVELSVKTWDAGKSARIANAITDVFLKSETRARSDVAQRAAESLRGRLEELRNQLSSSENAVEKYKLENNIINSSAGLLNESELNQVNVALVEARNRTSSTKVILEEINKLKKSGKLPQTLPGGIVSQTISSLRVQLSQASQRKISLSARYLETHPVMIAEELRLKDIRKSIFEELDRIASTAELEFNSALGQEKELQAKVTNLSNRTYSTNDAKVELRELQRDADSKRVVYEAFLIRAKELGGQVGINTNDARIISPASPPLQPSGLPSVVLLAGGTMAGFGLGCAFSLLGASISVNPNRRQTPSARPVAVSAPNGAIAKRMQNPLGRFFGAKPEPVTASHTSHEPDITPLRLPVLLNLVIPRNQMIADQIPFLDASNSTHANGKVIASIVNSISQARTKKSARIILVTGMEDSFGKSTFAGNLAFSGAQGGENVLLVGGDQSTASAVNSFSCSAELELEKTAGYKIAIGHDLRTDLPSGRYHLWPLRHSASVGRLHNMAQLKQLRDRLDNPEFATDLAIIDAPLLGDSKMIEDYANLADEVIVVMPANGSAGADGRDLIAALGSRRSRIRGIITVAYAA